MLRPRANVAAEAGAGGEPAQPLSLPMDAADANAIAEVKYYFTGNFYYIVVKKFICL